MTRISGFARRVLAVAQGKFAPLALAALLAGSLWAFVGIAHEVLEGETRALDEAILLALRAQGDPSDPIGPLWVEELGRDVTALGSVAILTFITLASAIFLFLCRRYRTALFVLVAIASGIALSFALRAGFDRPRPDLVPHGANVYTSSFPSGHSMMSALVYLTLAALLARMQPRKRVKVYMLLLAVLATTAIGASRVYLGVHWPTDVLAGWAAGTTWAVFCWMLAIWLQRRREIEASADASIVR